MLRMIAAWPSGKVAVVLRYLLGFASSVVLLAAASALEGYFANLVFSVFIAVTALAVLALGPGPRLLATFVSGVGIWFLFLGPSGSLSFAIPGDLARLAAYFVASLIVIYAIERLHRTRRRLEHTILDQRRTSAKLRALSESMPQLVFLARADGTSEYVNEQWMRYTGLDARAASRLSATALIHADDRDMVRRRWAEAIAADAPRQAELRYRAHDGSYRWFLVTVAPLKSAGGEMPRWMGTATDIHERKEAERRLRLVLEASPMGAALAETGGRVTYANEAYLKLTGYLREQLDQGELRWDRITPPEHADKDRTAIDQALARGVSDMYEKEYLRPDGTRVPVLLACASLGEGELAAFTLDLTERRMVEAQMRTLASVVQNSNDFISLYTSEMKPVFVNDAGRRMLGLGDRDVAETGLLDYFWPEDRGRIESEAVPRLVAEGQWSGEARFRSFATGEPIHTIWNAFAVRDEAGEPSGFATISPDLSRLKRAEQELRDSEERLRRLVENVQDYAIFMLDADGIVATWNAGAARVKGWSAEEIVGQHFSCLFTPEDRAADKPRHVLAEAERTGRTEDEGWRVRKDGSRFWANTVVTTLRDDSGRLRGFAKITRDFTARRQMEEALRQGEQRLRGMFDNAGVGILEVDREERLVAVNDRVLHILGFSREELLGRTVAEITHPEDRPARAGPRPALAEPLDFEKRFLKRDGTPVWVHVTVSGVHDSEGRWLRSVCTVEDITLRQRADEALRRSEAQFRQLAEAIPQFVWISRADGYQEYFNERWLEYIGTITEGALGDRWAQFLHPNDVDRALERWRYSLSTGEPFEIEYRFRRARDGTYRWFLARAVPLRDEKGDITRWFGTCTDIHDQKQAQAESFRAEQAVRAANTELRASEARLRGTAAALQRANERLRVNEERYRLVSQATHDVIWDWDVTNDEVVWNEAVETTVGYRLAEIPRGQAWWSENIHPEDRERVVEGIHAAIEDPSESSWSAEYRLRHRDGQWIDVLDRGFIARDEGHRAVRMIGSMLDVTERKRAEEGLRAANERLVEMDQRKNEFLAVLSHELRNPLSPIRNSVYVLDKAAPGSSQSRRALAVIDRQVHHMTRLIDDLLDVTRISRGKVRLQRERIELGELVRRTAEDHRSLFVGTDIGLEVHMPSARILVEGDATRLSQVVGNLLANAAKFTPRGGHVTLSLQTQDERALIRVSDTGAGIPPELIGRLFEPFVQAETTLDRSKGGLGLGLALVRGLVELHGGSVAVVSHGVGAGSEFTVSLPLAPASERRLHVVESPVALHDVRRVLVIEDNVDSADTLKEALELSGHEVEIAHEGLEGIDKARAFHPDVILCDIGLPGIDGYQVAERMRADPELRSVPLVALSGYALPEDLERSKEAGFVRHITKPPDLTALERTLAEASSAPAVSLS